MSAIYEQHASVLDEYVDVVRNVNCRGAIFTLHGRVAGLELFDSTSAWVRLMPKIVRSYAVEALGEGAHEKRSFELTPDALLDVISEAETASFTTFSDAFDVRIKGSAVTGAALVFGSRVIHLAVFADWLASNAGVVSTPQGTAR